MSAFREVLKASPEYKDLAGAVRGGRLPLGVLGLSPIHKAHLIDTLCGNEDRRALVIMPDEASATKLCADLQAFGLPALLYPGLRIRLSELRLETILMLMSLSQKSM